VRFNFGEKASAVHGLGFGPSGKLCMRLRRGDGDPGGPFHAFRGIFCVHGLWGVEAKNSLGHLDKAQYICSGLRGKIIN